METYTDYDTEKQIIFAAAQLGISFENRSTKDIYADIENKCPKVANLILERTNERDKVRAYILKNPERIVKNSSGDIEIGNDPFLNKFFSNDIDIIYAGIQEEINNCC
jgi:hypothetical protein